MRNRIMLAAYEEMNTQGVRFTMADLARQLAVSKTTIYQCFPSKDELVGAVIDALFDDIQQQEEAILGDPGLTFLEKIKGVLSVFPKVFGPMNNRLIDDLQRQMPGEQKKVERFKETKWQRIENLVRAEIEADRLRPINLAVLQRMYMLAASGLIDYKFLTQNNLSAREVCTEFAEILTFGMVNTRDAVK